METLTIEFRENSMIASEIVFPDVERNTANAFRFALRSYLYYKDRALLEFSQASGSHHQTVARQLGSTKNVTQSINHKMAEAVCKFYDVKFEYLYGIAVQFVKNPEYNSISFSGNVVIFIKAFKLKFTEGSAGDPHVRD